MSNRLANSSSAYLRSAAHQPIDWHEFGEEAFQLAKELDRPVLLDIGAVWCHWCHVIDRESYENDEIAALINQHYIPVKVDRDQRPDVDARYQQVVAAMSGQGGWPLTAFLTHDGRLIYGGTYFPPAAMKNLLTRIQDVYQERKAEIFNEKEMLTNELVEQHDAAHGHSHTHIVEGEPEIVPENLTRLCRDFSADVLQSIRRAYDAKNGGFGNQPKFHHFSALEAVMAAIPQLPAEEGEKLRHILSTTLEEMAKGGIYDQVAGGFHRYSVDDHWHVPHFEKMAYDNAEAIKVYSQAYRLTGNPFFRQITEEIIQWVREWLSDSQQGGFYASQDADIDLTDDGDHFTWSSQELTEILTEDEARVITLAYDVHAEGDMHHAAGRNVLYVSHPSEAIAQKLSLAQDQVESLLASAKGKMRDQRRSGRKIPFIDQSLYVNWNGMMIAAFFEAADLLDLPEVRQFAEQSLQRMLREFYTPTHTVLHTTGVDGFLDDYAWLGLAALKGYHSTENAEYLQAACDMADQLLQRFEDSRLGGFFDTPCNDNALGLLKFKRKPAEDNPSSSGNAIALRLLNALYLHTGRESYRNSMEKALNILVHLNGNYGLYVSALAIAAGQYLNPPIKLDVPSRNASLRQAARNAFAHGKLVGYPDEANAPDEIRVCVGTRCLSPVKNEAELLEQLQNLHQQTGVSR